MSGWTSSRTNNQEGFEDYYSTQYFGLHVAIRDYQTHYGARRIVCNVSRDGELLAVEVHKTVQEAAEAGLTLAQWIISDPEAV